MALLKQKIRPSRSEGGDGAGRVMEELLRVSMPRDADDLLGLDVSVLSVSNGHSVKEDLIQKIETNDLCFLMTSSHSPPGLCQVDGVLVATLIEKQMAGRVSSGEATLRQATQIDAAIVSEMIERWLEGAETIADEAGRKHRFPFFSHQRVPQLFDARAMDLSLDPGTFDTTRITLSLDRGQRKGMLSLAVPLLDVADKVSAKQLNEKLSDARAMLRAELRPVQLALGRVRALAIGDVVDIPLSALRDVRMMPSGGGPPIAKASLGQINGQRAVRLLVGDEPPMEPGAEIQPFLGGEDSAMPAPGLMEPPEMPLDALPDIPELPDLSTLGGEPEPALPDLPDLPDLPELPDLPDLPD